MPPSALTLIPHSVEISRWAKENHRRRVALQALMGVAVSHLDGGIPPGKLHKGRDGMMMMVMLMVILIMAKIVLI